MDTRDDFNPEVMAMADGELPPDAADALQARAADDPRLAAQLAHQRQLKAACARAMGEPATCPKTLRARVAAMLSREASGGEADAPAIAAGERRHRPAVLASIGRWVPAAVAAVLLITALILFVDFGSSLSSPGGPTARNTPRTQDPSGFADGRFASLTLPSDRIERFDARHRQCRGDLGAMYASETFPREVAALPGALSNYFHRPVCRGGLDLSRIGYGYQIAGRCSVPGKGAVHVLYKALPGTGRSDSLSLWLRPYDPQTLQLERDRLYLANGDGDRPLLVWREGDLVYYLMGERMPAVEEAAAALHAAATTADGA